MSNSGTAMDQFLSFVQEMTKNRSQSTQEKSSGTKTGKSLAFAEEESTTSPMIEFLDYVNNVKKKNEKPSAASALQNPLSVDNDSDFDAFIAASSEKQVQENLQAAAVTKAQNDAWTLENYFGWLGNKAMSGLAGFEKGVTSTADLILGNTLEFFGWENNPVNKLADHYSDVYDAFVRKSEEYENKMGGGAALSFAGDVVEATTGALPNAILALMTKGASLKATSLTTTAAYETGSILTKAGLTVADMMKNPQYWLSFASTYGTDYEEAIANGASEATAALGATLTSLINAGIEIGFDGMSGIQGLPQEIAEEGGSKALKWAISAAEEGGEEGLQKFVNEAVTKVLYNQDADILNPEEYAKEMTIGTLVGAGLGSGQLLANNATTTTQKRKNTQLTQNEQAVVDKVFENEVKHREESGEKLSKSEKNKLYDQVLKQMEDGDISTDVIEEVLGGETYKTYKDTVDSEDALQKEFDKLKQVKASKATLEQQERYKELKRQIAENKKNSSRSQLNDQLSREVSELVKNDRLSESYNERSRRGQAFEVDVNQYSGKARETVQNALDSGILNNTNKTHFFVDLVAKISGDKGVAFNFADNKKLRETGFALEGVTVNGFVNGDGVTININSAKALNSVVGHEITHVLEGTEFYDTLKTAVEAYAKSKGEYDSRLEQLTKLYEGRDANVEQELVADLVGDYLFTDSDFISRLSTEHRGVFDKLFDEIKYLCKVAKAGSKEARQLEKVKKAFEDAYRTETKNPTGDGGVRYSIQEKAMTADSTEQERYELLKNAELSVAKVNVEKLSNIDLEAYNTRKKSAVSKGLRDLASRLGILNADLENSRISFPFQFSTGNLYKSLHHQLEYGGTYQDYAKAMTCFNEIVEAAIPIEVHKEKKTGTSRENPDLKNVYVLVSAFQDGKDIIPVELEVKEFQERGKSLYMTVMLTKIDPEVVDAGIPSETGDVPHLFSRSTISLRQLFTNVNPKDGRFLKYVPDGFLSNEQKRAKQEALLKQEREYANYSLSSAGDVDQPTRGGIYAKDVLLEGLDAISENTAADQDIADSELVAALDAIAKDTDVESQYAEPFPSEEDLMETELREMDDAFRVQTDGEGYTSSLYDSGEGGGVDTVARRLEVKRQNAQWELEASQKSRQEAMAAYDEKIASMQAKYDAKPNKHTKAAEKLQRQIQRMQRLKADRLTEYDKQINDIQSRIEKITGELNKDHSKQDKLEMAYSRIDRRLEADVADLTAEFDQRRQELTEQIGNKTKYVKDRAIALYDELQNLRKGVRASTQLGYLKDAGFGWGEIRQALAAVSQSPTIPIQKDSAAESAARETLLREYEDRMAELDDLDNQYQQEVKALEEQAEKEKQEATVAHQRRVKQGQYDREAAELMGDTSTWVDKKLGLSYQTNTLHRNLRDVVRDADGNRDIQRADAIYDHLQGSYNRNEAELNREATRVKQPYADMDINQYEDAYIQMLGELRHNPDTKLLPWDVEEYYQKHKRHIDTAKVDKAIEMARETYDTLLQRVNAVLREQGMKEIPYRKGYFPHFTKDKQGFLARLLNWKTRNDNIPTDIAGLTEQFNPNRSWQSFNKRRTSDTTDYSFLKGLDTYVQGSLDWIYHIEDIQRRRAFENQIRYRHSDAGIQAQIDEAVQSNQYDADGLQAKIDDILKEAGNPLNNFVTDLRTGTNILAGKKSSMDRGMEQMTNRRTYSVMTNISNRVSANIVAGSVSSALTNFIPITQSWAQVSPVSSLKAMGQTIRSTFRDDGMVNKSDFLTNRLRKAESLYKRGWDKVSDKVGFMMEAVDSFTSQTVWRSKYLENFNNGMSEAEAIRNADQFAENVMAGRSRGDMPTIFESKNPIIKLFTAFQLEVANQYGYMLKDLPQDMKTEATGKLVAGYAKMFLGAYAYNALYSSLTGRDAAFDPIGIIEDLLRDMGLLGDDEEEPTDIALNLTENILDEMPFIGGLLGGGRIPISSALPYDGDIEDIISGLGQLAEGDFSDVGTEWLNPVYYLVSPMGGGQIRKTVQGLDMYGAFDWLTGADHSVAGSYTASGKLRFPVNDDIGSILKAGIFGQWASENAQQYIEEGRSPLSEKQTQELVDTGMTIQEYWDYRDGLSGLTKLAEKADYINSLDLTVEQKNILINNIANRDDPIDMTDYDQYGSFEEFDFAHNYPEKYALAQAVGGYESYTTYRSKLNKIESDKDANGNAISGSREEKVAAYINSLDAEYGEKIILYVSEYNSAENRSTYGYEIIDYLNSRSDISYQQMKTILEELGFTVDNNGNITWD